MSYKWPRRVQDMTPLQRGSTEEDINETDAKSPELIKKKPPLKLVPKRVSEITPQKSDTDEEIDGPDDNDDKDNLNCARRLTQFDYMSSGDSDNDATPQLLPATPPTTTTTTSKPPLVVSNVLALAAQNENNRNKLNSPSLPPLSANTPPNAGTSIKSISSSSSISSTLSAPFINDLQQRKPLATAGASAAALPPPNVATVKLSASSAQQQPAAHQPFSSSSSQPKEPHRLLPGRPREPEPVYRQMMPSLGVHRQHQQQQQPQRQPQAFQTRPSTATGDTDDGNRPNRESIFKTLHQRGPSSAHVRSASTDAPHIRLPHLSRPMGQPPATAGRSSDPSNSSTNTKPAAHHASCSSSSSNKRTTSASASAAAPPLAPSSVIVAASSSSSSNPGVAFKTPAIEYSTHRVAQSSRLPPLVRTNSSKSRSEMQSEFQSKMVLFHTPSTMMRSTSGADQVPLSVAIAQANHSIDLSLDDSVPAPQPVVLPSIVSRTSALSTTTKAAQLAAPQPSPPPGDAVLHINGKVYVLQMRIGSGGSSTVYLAQQWDTKAEVAVKMVDLQGDPAIVTGYMNETKLLAKLQGDDTVIRLFDYVHIADESTLYVVMERGDHDLHHVLHTYGITPMPLYVLMRLWHQMLLAVGYIHRNGVIHSDLKPANFLLVDGRLKLIDFGIASNIAVDSTSIIKFSQAGTFNYISPEALIDTSTGDSPARGQQPKIKISTKSDVWSLGCILYLLLYKRTPFAHITNLHAKMMAIVSHKSKIEYGALPNFVPGIFLEMLQRCLVYAPKQRASVAELLQSPYDIVVPHDTLGLISERSSSSATAAASSTTARTQEK